MTDINQNILNYIKQNKSVNEISNLTGLSQKQIFQRITSLENKGYLISRKYTSDGNIIYTFDNKEDKVFKLYNGDKTLKIIAISDLHIGNARSDEGAYNSIYNYAVNNGIHLIFNCGDLLDGTYTKYNKELLINPEQQIEYLVTNAPFDKSIISLNLMGDHDISLRNVNLSLANALKCLRHDMIPLVSSDNDLSSKININNNIIEPSHKSKNPKETIKNVKLQLAGHKHINKFLISTYDSLTPRIYVPSLSYICLTDQTSIPRAIELEIKLDKDFNFEHLEKSDLLILNDKVIKTGVVELNYQDKAPVYVDEEKNIGELNQEQRQMVNDFFGRTGKNKSLDKMIKKSRKK